MKLDKSGSLEEDHMGNQHVNGRIIGLYYRNFWEELITSLPLI
jgi:hypothetical protein